MAVYHSPRCGPSATTGCPLHGQAGCKSKLHETDQHWLLTMLSDWVRAQALAAQLRERTGLSLINFDLIQPVISEPGTIIPCNAVQSCVSMRHLHPSSAALHQPPM